MRREHLSCCFILIVLLASHVVVAKRFILQCRRIAGSLALAVPLFSCLPSADAAWFSSSATQDEITNIAKCQRPVHELLEQLTPQKVSNAVGDITTRRLLNGGSEDNSVVNLNLERIIQPCQKEMEQAVKSLNLKPENQKRAEVLPLLMKGHILELTQAVANNNPEQQAREVEEVEETLQEFLTLAAEKYKVKLYVKPVALSEKDYLGPFGCEFWGKVRAPDSNKCVVPSPPLGPDATAAAITANTVQ